MIVDRPDLLPASVARTIAAVAPAIRAVAQAQRAIAEGRVLDMPVPEHVREQFEAAIATSRRHGLDAPVPESVRLSFEAALDRYAAWNVPPGMSPSEQLAAAKAGLPPSPPTENPCHRS